LPNGGLSELRKIVFFAKMKVMKTRREEEGRGTGGDALKEDHLNSTGLRHHREPGSYGQKKKVIRRESRKLPYSKDVLTDTHKWERKKEIASKKVTR